MNNLADFKNLKLGKSFFEPGDATFHTLRCTLHNDFKPVSIDDNGLGELKIENGNRVTAVLPNVEGAVKPNTTFCGSMKNAPKECILIIDHETGEITLEKVTSAIQLKKTRSTNTPTLGVKGNLAGNSNVTNITPTSSNVSYKLIKPSNSITDEQNSQSSILSANSVNNEAKKTALISNNKISLSSPQTTTAISKSSLNDISNKQSFIDKGKGNVDYKSRRRHRLSATTDESEGEIDFNHKANIISTTLLAQGSSSVSANKRNLDAVKARDDKFNPFKKGGLAQSQITLSTSVKSSSVEPSLTPSPAPKSHPATTITTKDVDSSSTTTYNKTHTVIPSKTIKTVENLVQSPKSARASTSRTHSSSTSHSSKSSLSSSSSSSSASDDDEQTQDLAKRKVKNVSDDGTKSSSNSSAVTSEDESSSAEKNLVVEQVPEKRIDGKGDKSHPSSAFTPSRSVTSAMSMSEDSDIGDSNIVASSRSPAVQPNEPSPILSGVTTMSANENSASNKRLLTTSTKTSHHGHHHGSNHGTKKLSVDLDEDLKLSESDSQSD